MITIMSSYHYMEVEAVKEGYSGAILSDQWDWIIAEQVNKNPIIIEVDGTVLSSETGHAYLSRSGEVMIPCEVLREGMRCATRFYDGNRLIAEKNTRKLEVVISDSEISSCEDDGSIENPLVMKDGSLFVASSVAANALQYNMEWNQQERWIRFKDQNPTLASLPVQYDQRMAGRSPVVRDQGSENTCWAYVACETLEASLLPEEHLIFSQEHMVTNNSFYRTPQEGGEYSIAMSYLLAWQGPVKLGEESGNIPVKHVQEIQLIPKKDLEKIKEAVYLYGGVQSSLYFDLANETSESIYYNKTTNSYKT